MDLRSHAAPDPAIPGPKGLPIVGAIPQMMSVGRFEYIAACSRTYGDIFRLPLIHLPLVGRSPRLRRLLALEKSPRDLIVTSNPEAIERVLLGNHENYIKGPNYDVVRALMGQGLVTSTGELWHRQRRLLQPAFRRPAIQDFLPTFERCTADMLTTWERRARSGVAFDVYREMMDLARRIIGLTMFGMDLGESDNDSARAVTDSIDCLGRRMEGTFNLPLDVPTPDNLRFKRARATLDRIVYDIIERARRGQQDSDEPNILKSMLEARDEVTGAGMSTEQIHDEVITLYIAGHETTALTLSWTLYFLSVYPAVRERVDAEIASVPEHPGLDDLDRMTYTRMVIDEVLRLRPPAWALAREAVGDDELLGRRIPAGALVMFYIYGAHRHPAHWDGDVEAFDPERFAPERAQRRHKFAYLPFSAGPRICIGKAFSIYETLLALSAILRRYRPVYAGNEPVRVNTVATIRPDGPVMMRLEPR